MFKELVFFTKMVITTKTYKLSKIKQLIDLNGDTVNFDLTFSAKSSDGSKFDALVVSQDQLDSGEPLEYKKADGSISGSIVADKDVYQNYFLLLKSDNPVDCEVKIDMKNIPTDQVLLQKQKIQEQMLHNENLQKEHELNQQMLHQQAALASAPIDTSINDTPLSSSQINWKLIFLIGLILVGGYLVWSFYIKNRSLPNQVSSNNVPSIISDNIPPIVNNQVNNNPISNSLSLGESESFINKIQSQNNVLSNVVDGAQNVIDNSLLHKLNNLNVWNKLKT
jgi:hypothetical protein